MKSQKKRTFMVLLNWHGQVFRLYTQATRSDLAAQNCISRVAKVLGRDRYSTNLHFQHGDRVLVREANKGEIND